MSIPPSVVGERFGIWEDLDKSAGVNVTGDLRSRHVVAIASGTQPKLKITRRHLPHWELEGASYFVSFHCESSCLSLAEILIVKNLIIDGNNKFYHLLATVVMPDHVHIVFSPLPGYSLSRILKGTKGKSARLINLNRGTSGSIWQAESYDRIIRDEDEFLEKLNYMLENPIKRGFADDPWNYPGWYLNTEGEAASKK